MSIRLILAVNANNTIDFENWDRKPPKADLQRYAALTIGNNCLVGRKTWESLPPAAKRHRTFDVFTSNPHLVLPENASTVKTNFDFALDWYRRDYKTHWCIGGLALYKAALPFAEYVYLTAIIGARGGTLVAPELDEFKFLVTQDHGDHLFSIWKRDEH